MSVGTCLSEKKGCAAVPKVPNVVVVPDDEEI